MTSSFVRSEPLQFNSSGTQKDTVYNNNPGTEDDLEGNTLDIVPSILAAELQCAMSDVFVRCDVCL